MFQPFHTDNLREEGNSVSFSCFIKEKRWKLPHIILITQIPYKTAYLYLKVQCVRFR